MLVLKGKVFMWNFVVLYIGVFEKIVFVGFGFIVCVNCIVN